MMQVQMNDQLLVAGPTAASDTAAEMSARGWRRAAVFASPSAVARGQLDRLRSTALEGLDVVRTFDAIREHAPVGDIDAFAAELWDEDIDVLVALGGGSVSDSAKGVAILLAEGGGLLEHCSVFDPPDRLFNPRLERPKLPVVAVATTLSAAEITPGGGTTTADGIKRTFWDRHVAARIACYDTGLLADVPREVLVSTGMNALAHCVEGLYSRTRNPISDALAVSATSRLADGLRAVADGEPDHDELTSLAVGAAMSGLVISSARVGVHHAVCHVLGARHGVPHGVANSVMLPHSLRFNLAVTRGAQQVFAGALGVDIDDPPAGVRDFQTSIGAPSRLRDVGVVATELAAVARETMQDRGLYFNPRRVTAVDPMIEMLEAAW